MVFAKIPRHTSQNAITEGDFLCILARNCEGTEQLQYILSLTLTRCSRKNQNWSTGPINDMQCKKSHSKNN